MSKDITYNHLYAKIAELLHTARQTVVLAVNQKILYSYYEFGRMTVEDEQQEKERAGEWQAAIKRTFQTTDV